MILRSCGIPATIYEVPFWGSRNGSHAGDAFWSSKAQKMITRYEWVTYDPEYYVRPTKVIRYTYRYTGAYSDHNAPYLNGEELQIPQMTRDHWCDATADHTAVSEIKISISHKIAERMGLGYLYVMNYGEWVPVSYRNFISLHNPK